MPSSATLPTTAVVPDSVPPMTVAAARVMCPDPVAASVPPVLSNVPDAATVPCVVTTPRLAVTPPNVSRPVPATATVASDSRPGPLAPAGALEPDQAVLPVTVTPAPVMYPPTTCDPMNCNVPPPADSRALLAVGVT